MDKSYTKLEFDQVLKLVSKHAHTHKASSMILDTHALTNYEGVVQALKHTDEVMRLGASFDVYSLDSLYDIEDFIQLALNKHVLNGLDLYQIACLQDVCINLNNYVKNIDQKDNYPWFVDRVKSLESMKEVSEQIKHMINPNGLIYEDATEDLIRINRQINEVNNKITSYLSRFIKDNAIHLTESIVSSRNNRAVVMVKQASKNIIKGIIHDESSSKQTAFIEPSAVVEYNNQLQNLENEKAQQIEIILRALTDLVLEHMASIKHNFAILIDLDMTRAKALYTTSIDGIIPSINKESAKLEIYQGKHPLIDKDKVVANDFFMCNNETKYRIVLISGSNTGGKTVALKMVGLFSLMVQSGIGICANEKSNMPIYSEVFVDIGDEQSIENSLSTFSSRLNNVIDICQHVSKNSLVLFDELGSGTDPREGENLALAILEYLYEKDASVIVTTHYSKLKNWAITSEYVRSASVLFDEKTNQPIYKVVFDSFASSNAFKIALNLGLDKSIVDQAIALYESDLDTSDELLLKLEQNQQEIREIEKVLQDKIKETDKKESLLQSKLIKLEQDKTRVLEQATLQANEIVAKASAQSKLIIDELKKQDKFVNHEVNKLTSSLDDLYIEKQVEDTPDDYPYELNDLVQLVKLNRSGHITKIIGKDAFEVSIGNLKTKVKRNEIRFVSKDQNKVAKEKKKIKERTYASKKVATELNLIGMRVEEAQRALNKYLDDAIVANLNSVRIVHGFGTGALRNMVIEVLKKNKHIKNYHFAAYNEGGQGATIANLR